MIGAIIGDIVGSHYEGSHRAFVKDITFPLFSGELSKFTDDTVLTCATADALINPSMDGVPSFAEKYKDWATRYPNRGYGSKFKEWLAKPQIDVLNSFGNGCMMRCSPIGLFAPSMQSAMYLAEDSTKFTHNSPESVRGTKAIVTAIQMALSGKTKAEMKSFIEENYGHMMDRSLKQWREEPKTSIRCNFTAPQALTCFFLSTDYESAIRNAVYTRGDTDTIAAIAGAIAEAYYDVRNISPDLIAEAKKRLPDEMVTLINSFYERVGVFLPQYQGFQI